MFSGFFNYDNSVWRFIGKFGDLIILNVLWFICSIPIVTIGASTTAVYYVTLKLVRDDDGYTIRSFFKSFKENFKQSTIIWLIMLALGFVLAFDLYFFLFIQNTASTIRTVMMAVFLAMAILYFAVFTYIFPLQSRFYNPLKKTFFNAFYMSVRHLFHTIAIIALDIAVLVLSFWVPQVLMIVILFGLPMFAFMNSYILTPVFNRYMPKEACGEDEMKPLFSEDGGIQN